MEFVRDNSEMGCPVDGKYKYIDGEVLCELHRDFDKEDEDGDEVPWL